MTERLTIEFLFVKDSRIPKVLCREGGGKITCVLLAGGEGVSQRRETTFSDFGPPF